MESENATIWSLIFITTLMKLVNRTVYSLEGHIMFFSGIKLNAYVNE